MRHRASNGTELLDWQEVWCFRCRHDHQFSHGPIDTGAGCEIMALGSFDYEADEWIDSGYDITFTDEDGERHTHTIPDVVNSLPAATVCTKWEPCGPVCMTHVNGAVIVDIQIGGRP